MKTCSIAGCDKPYLAKGLCRSHYYKQPKWKVASARYTQNWRDRNGERLPELRRAARLANLELRRAQQREYMRRWREAHPEEVKERVARWRAAHPEQFAMIKRAQLAVRRMRLRGQTVGRVDYAAVLAEHGMICHICGDEIETTAVLHFDHVIPIACGGPHSQANIKPSHRACNQRKGANITEEHRPSTNRT